jgi:hypothetical protein
MAITNGENMKIGICIVHFGAQEILDKCLNSLEGHLLPSGNFAVFTQDNNIDNLGFTIGSNKLIKQTIDEKYDWIWLLNNDTTVPSSTLQAIEEKLPLLDQDIIKAPFPVNEIIGERQKSNIGIIGFQIRSLDEPDFIHHGGTGQCFPAGVHKTGSVKLKQLNKTTSEKWVTFASVLIRREVFEKIGLLDENMKFIGSDSDFCFRARAAGFKVTYEPSFVIYHKIGQSQKADNDPILKQMKQDMIYFQGKWLNGKLYFDLERELL